MINESKPIINSYLLDELKRSKTDFNGFIKWYKETTNDSIKISKGFIGLDEMESNYLISYNVIYSMILRLRGIFLIRSILNKDKFSNSFFKKFIIKFIPEFEFKKIYKVYKDLRDNKKTANVKIEIDIVKKLLEILNNEVKSLNAK